MSLLNRILEAGQNGVRYRRKGNVDVRVCQFFKLVFKTSSGPELNLIG